MVRRGLDRHLTGRTVADVEVLHPRAVRRHLGGADDLVGQLTGRRIQGASRRGKYLWLPLLESGGGVQELPAVAALGAHLGMSGQLLIQPPDLSDEVHLRVRVRFDDGGSELRFVDQRTFGGVAVEPLVDDGSGGQLPRSVAHIARDPLDPSFDDDLFRLALRRKRTGIKRALLDQTLVSGVGNIYADEALWRARLHFARPTETLTKQEVARLLSGAREVMGAALAQGGTSFDALYVNVNGESGYFERSLEVYGQRDQPCSRCGTLIRRDAFMNRSSYSCPTCQPRPRRGSW